MIISGDVQGVGFRSQTRWMARKLGLKGWVKNIGTIEVETVFEGDEASVRQMVKWCKRGPKTSKVSGSKVEFEKYTKEFENFQIL
ncbi:MAG: acylphosphatase [Candidatus Aenigmatarchaeota archaeon]